MKNLKNIALTLAALTFSATSAFAADPVPATPEDETVPSYAATDINQDGSTNINDLLMVLKSWGAQSKGGQLAADIDGDGTVGFGDMLAVISNYGA